MSTTSIDTRIRRCDDNNDNDFVTRKLLIHWRGEKDVGYSKPFRQLEFLGALQATNHASSAVVSMQPKFQNALQYQGDEFMPDVNMEHFNEAMQFVSFDDNDENDVPTRVSRTAVIAAASRCSLVHALYEVIAQSDQLDDLAELAIHDGGFVDMYHNDNDSNENDDDDNLSWCFRARSYLGDFAMGAHTEGSEATPYTSKSGKVKRYSSSSRSMGLERKGLKALTPLLAKLGGKVDLLNPQVKIYIFDGIHDEGRPQKVLARRIASGPRVS